MSQYTERIEVEHEPTEYQVNVDTTLDTVGLDGLLHQILRDSGVVFANQEDNVPFSVATPLHRIQMGQAAANLAKEIKFETDVEVLDV